VNNEVSLIGDVAKHYASRRLFVMKLVYKKALLVKYKIIELFIG